MLEVERALKLEEAEIDRQLARDSEDATEKEMKLKKVRGTSPVMSNGVRWSM